MAIGSGHMFADKYIDQEKNEKFREMIFEFLTTTDHVRIIPSDHDDIDVSLTFDDLLLIWKLDKYV